MQRQVPVTRRTSGAPRRATSRTVLCLALALAAAAVMLMFSGGPTEVRTTAAGFSPPPPPPPRPHLRRPSLSRATPANGGRGASFAPTTSRDDDQQHGTLFSDTTPPPQRNTDDVSAAVSARPPSATAAAVEGQRRNKYFLSVTLRLPSADPYPVDGAPYAGGPPAPWQPRLPFAGSPADAGYPRPAFTRPRLERLRGPIPPDIPAPWSSLAALYAGIDDEAGPTVGRSSNVPDPFEELPVRVAPFMHFQGADLYEGMRSEVDPRAFVESRPGQSFSLGPGHVGAIERMVFHDDAIANVTATGRRRWGRRLPILHVRTLAIAHFILGALPRLHRRLAERRAAGDTHPYGFVLVTSLNDDGPKYWLNRFVRDHEDVRRHCPDCPTGDLGHDHPLLQYLLQSPMLAHWFMQNADVSYPNDPLLRFPFDGPVPLPDDASLEADAASIVSAIPIGMDYHSARTPGQHLDFGYGEPASARIQEADLGGIPTVANYSQRLTGVVADARVHTRRWLGANPPRIKLQREKLQRLVSADHVVFPMTDRRNLWRLYGNFSFVASPAGHGLDCHRTWEALSLGAVPIVSFTARQMDLFRGLPVVMVRNFDAATLSLSNLAAWQSEIAANKVRGAYDMGKLTNAYWWQRFRAAASLEP